MRISVNTILTKCRQIMNLTSGNIDVANLLADMLFSLGFEKDPQDKWILKIGGRKVNRDAPLAWKVLR